MLTRVTSLFRNVVIYGMGDAATSVVSLLLLPIFTKFLTPADYGVITMLLTIEAVTKVMFRWGVDTAFMRLFYDCADRPAQTSMVHVDVQWHDIASCAAGASQWYEVC